MRTTEAGWAMYFHVLERAGIAHRHSLLNLALTLRRCA